jgi:carbon monoxide dehydrogenase subunit G
MTTFRIERSVRIAAGPAEIAPLIEDFRRWGSWSPYDKMDPAAERTFSGAASGVGAVYEWNGRKTGAGRMEIVEIQKDRIVLQLDFKKPFRASNKADFILAKEGEDTHVTWAMYGEKTLISKVMGLFVSIDEMVGKDFEKGLADIKQIAEKKSGRSH